MRMSKFILNLIIYRKNYPIDYDLFLDVFII